MPSRPDTQFKELFAVPFLQYQWPDSEELNRELRTAILAKQEAADGRMSWIGNNIGGWHSDKDLQTWPQSCVKELIERIDVMTRDMVSRIVSEPHKEHLEHWSVQAWANVSHRGHNTRSHGHRRRLSDRLGTLLAGIYYVDVGEQTGSSENGITVFEDWSGVPKEVMRNPNPFEREHTIQPVAGLMVLFPGRLRHRVNLYLGDAPRVTVAFNLSHPEFTIPNYQVPPTKNKGVSKPLNNKLEAGAKVEPHSPIDAQLQQVRSLKNIHTRVYAASALMQGLSVEILSASPARIAISDGSHHLVITNARLNCNDQAANKLSWDKFRSYELLTRNCIAVPEHQLFRRQQLASAQDVQRAVLDSSRFPFPKVLKPNCGGGSRDVYIVKDISELERALVTTLDSRKQDLLLEQFVAGSHYRVFLCRHRIVDILHRRNAFVMGDGVSTVRELIERQNEERKRFGEPKVPESLIEDSTDICADSVPDMDERLQLCRLVNFSLGGDVFRVNPETVHSENRALVVQISKLFGLEVCCVDLIMSDISLPFHLQTYAVNEVNRSPGMFLPYMADRGKSIQCSEGILTQYFSTHSSLDVVEGQGRVDKPIELSDVAVVSARPGFTVEQDSILVDRNGHKICSLNETGLLLWRLCTGQWTLSEIVDFLEHNYPDHQARIRQQVEDTLLSFDRYGAVLFSESSMRSDGSVVNHGQASGRPSKKTMSGGMEPASTPGTKWIKTYVDAAILPGVPKA